MLRTRLSDSLKTALLNKDTARTATIRLILAALKDRDIAAREKGNYDGIPEEEILQMLQGMIKQRKESIALYEQGNRPDLVASEAKEISIIQEFLPTPLSKEETEKIILETLKKLDAQSIKDMGRVITDLRANYTGTMDFAEAASFLKAQLK